MSLNITTEFPSSMLFSNKISSNVTSTSTESLLQRQPFEAEINLSFLRFIAVILLRAGSLLAQMGMFPTENVYNIITQNVVDMAVTILSFSIFGCFFSLGKYQLKGFISYGSWIGSSDVDGEKAMHGLCASLIGTHVITSQTSGRLHIAATIILAVLYSGVILPLTMFWAWNPNSWMHQDFLGTKVRYADYSGGLIIYATSGLTGFVAMVILGRRLLRLQGLDASSIGVESLGATVLGNILIYIGLTAMSFNGTFTTAGVNQMMYKNALASSIGVVVTLSVQIAFCRNDFDYWAILKILQGNLAAVVALSSGVVWYGAYATITISIIGSVIYVITSRVVQLSPWEDYCNCMAIYLVNGIIGVIYPHFFLSTTSFATFIKASAWQLICTVAIIIFTVVGAIVTCQLLKACLILRNKSDYECHTRAKNLQHHLRRSFFTRFFDPHYHTTILEPGAVSKSLSKPSTPKPQRQASHTLLFHHPKESDGVQEKSIFTLTTQNVEASDENVIYKLQDLMAERSYDRGDGNMNTLTTTTNDNPSLSRWEVGGRGVNTPQHPPNQSDQQ